MVGCRYVWRRTSHQSGGARARAACGVLKYQSAEVRVSNALACVRHFLRYLEGVSIAAVYFLISLGWGGCTLGHGVKPYFSPQTTRITVAKSEKRGKYSIYVIPPRYPFTVLYCCLTFLSVRTVTRLPPLTDLELLSPRAGVELELALLRFGERLEREAALSLLAQRAQLEVIGGVERCGDRHVEVDQLEKLPP